MQTKHVLPDSRWVKYDDRAPTRYGCKVSYALLSEFGRLVESLIAYRTGR